MDGDAARKPNALGEARRVARAWVGELGLKEALALVRNEMVDEALRQCDGSRRAAARVLDVDRRVVQRSRVVGPPRSKLTSGSDEDTGVHRVVRAL